MLDCAIPHRYNRDERQPTWLSGPHRRAAKHRVRRRSRVGRGWNRESFARRMVTRSVMPTDMTWRDIINRYLDACREDQQVSARAETHVHRMLMQFGTSSLIRHFTDLRTVRAQRAEQPLEPVEGYALIKESHDLVLAEVNRCDNGQPPIRSRFRIVQCNGVWFLDGVYWACHCEDGQCFSCEGGKCKHCSGGRCAHCDGKGAFRRWVFFPHSCVLCKRSGLCFLCRGNGVCSLCDGLGRCRSCVCSDMPGWISVYQSRAAKSGKGA